MSENTYNLSSYYSQHPNSYTFSGKLQIWKTEKLSPNAVKQNICGPLLLFFWPSRPLNSAHNYVSVVQKQFTNYSL